MKLLSWISIIQNKFSITYLFTLCFIHYFLEHIRWSWNLLSRFMKVFSSGHLYKFFDVTCQTTFLEGSVSLRIWSFRIRSIIWFISHFIIAFTNFYIYEIKSYILYCSIYTNRSTPSRNKYMKLLRNFNRENWIKLITKIFKFLFTKGLNIF